MNKLKKTIRLKENKINRYSKTMLEDYICSFGIARENVNSFIGTPRPTDADDPFKLKNMREAAELAYHTCRRPDAKVFIQVDSDCDGYTSSAILIQYLRRRFPELVVEYRMHNGKEHGVIPNTVPQSTNLVFIPDAGSNQHEEVAELVRRGIAVIILDHHEVNAANGEMNFDNVVLVNNQVSPDFSNKSLSGAGVTYLFCQAMDRLFFTLPVADTYADLAAIGIIADAMNMTSLGNNYLAYWGLNNIKNRFIAELARAQARGIKDPEHLTKIDVMFYIAPVINGTIRSGDSYDKQTVFRAMVEQDCEELFNHEWRGVIKKENLYQHAVRIAMNAKSRQDNNKKKSFNWLCDKIEEKGWNKDNLIIATLNEDESAKVSANVTGLIAMELVKHYNRPCLVLRETEYEGKIMYGGSGRNGSFYGLPSLLDFLKDSGLAYYAEGHNNAHGTFLLPEQVDALRDYANKHIDATIFESEVVDVDYWFDENETVDYNMLYTFSHASALYGNPIREPLFAFDMNVSISQDMSFLGDAKNTVKIRKDGVDFISFKNDELVKEIRALNSDKVHIQLIGRPTLNEFRGTYQVQVTVKDNDDIAVWVPNRSIAAARPEAQGTTQKVAPRSLLDLL